ncbi:GerMN domain-containing protein [Clostridium sp. MSJ-11]|uniref:GerMN domain-containing protein n=1 Tax=Clostridium mobile TaxID=2841512 RepID=A0ABS6EEQ9_9CLOT|nr:GerMN domain-containing protein [Clostridium mobile]MBU5483705.1 GerMN domain-containing protein [Clostridium mobile]
MKKRLFTIVISIIFAIVLISCKSNENKLDGDKNPNETPTITEEISVKDTRCRLYFFNISELKHYYIDKTLPIENDALITALTKELQSTSYNKDFLSLTDKVEVKSAKLDETTGVLKIVFSDSYVDNMNLGSSTESGLLTSLIATYGYNLGVDKIAIYFNDELSTCLKGDLPNGYFTVEYPTAEPYNP